MTELELEQTTENEEVEEVEQSTEDLGNNYSSNDGEESEVDYEEYLRIKEELREKNERLAKAEKRIVEEKKEKKQIRKTSASEEDVITRKDLEIIRFIDKNPEFDGYEDDLKDYLGKGLSLQEASLLIKSKDKVLSNKPKTAQMSVAQGSPDAGIPVYTLDKYESLPPKERQRILSMVDQGKAVLKR